MPKHIALSLLAITLLASCGGSDKKSPEVVPPENTTPPNNSPIANAGEDMTTVTGAKIFLRGSGTDSDGTVTSYLWKQTIGTEADINDVDQEYTKVTLPELTQDEVLTFTLTVTDNDGATHQDLVRVHAKADAKWKLNETSFLDVDGDGLADIVTTFNSYYEISKLSYKKNLGDGSFSKEIIIDQSIPNYITFVKAGNIDNKYGTDLSVVTPDSIYNYYSDPEKQLMGRLKISGEWNITKYQADVPENVVLPDRNSNPYSSGGARFSLHDFNGDGLLDYSWLTISDSNPPDCGYLCYLVYRVMNLDGVNVSKPAKLGSNYPWYPGWPSGIKSLSAADVNQDGVSELIYEEFDGDDLSGVRTSVLHWFKKDEVEGGEIELSLSSNQSSQLVQFIDWDEDQDLDVINWASQEVTNLYHNTGSGEFSSFSDVSALNIIAASFVTDMDKDGIQDFVNISYKSNEASGSIIWQKKLISAVEPSQKLIDYTGKFIAARDLDNDGGIDFIIKEDNTLFWFKNLGNLTFKKEQIVFVE